MTTPSANTTTRHWAIRLLALCCIVVLAVFFTVQVAHHHTGTNSDDHCPLCLAAHWALPATATLILCGFYFFSAAYRAVEAAAAQRIWHVALANRPPPACELFPA